MDQCTVCTIGYTDSCGNGTVYGSGWQQCYEQIAIARNSTLRIREGDLDVYVRQT